MNEEIFLFDTYAILEIISGSKNYSKYLNCGIIINTFIFAELCYKLIREKTSIARLDHPSKMGGMFAFGSQASL